jgi:hypothetical protein
VEAASCENAAAWAGNTNAYILCRYRPRLVTDMGVPHLHPPKAVFFFNVANKIFVTRSEEAHNNTSLMTVVLKPF